jgi:hypothetical protein
MNNCVVFDLDETLGYFSEFGIFWGALGAFFKRPLTQLDFNMTLDLYPEFIRPNIMEVLTFLKYKKMAKKCGRMMIYTNNQGPKEWVMFIKSYFEWKMGGVIFDRIISAFKVNGVRVELGRTTHGKTHADFINCSKIPENARICFIDDVFHPEMENDNVYYIRVDPYIYKLPCEILINRYLKTHSFANSAQFISKCMERFARFKFVQKTEAEYEDDKRETKRIKRLVRLFFNQSNTRRIKRRTFGNKTRRFNC